MARNAVPDLSNMAACIEDARRATLDQSSGPADPEAYGALLKRLSASREKLPPLYRDAVCDPLVSQLEAIGEGGFGEVLGSDPRRERAAGMLLDLSQTILQNGEAYEPLATDAFQEVISDLYDGFLSAEDRRGVKPPNRSVVAPLVKWGDPSFGPYTWTVEATRSLGLKTGAVSLPPSNASAGLMAWAALGHETAGHDILGADDGLRAELTRIVRAALAGDPKVKGLAGYWARCIDETASDVMGILNIGPAAGIGLVAYFRGMNAAYGSGPVLRNDGPASDEHPADILRGYLAAETVRLLGFSGAKAWSDAIARETDRDATAIRIEGRPVKRELARRSAAIVSAAIASSRLESLEGHALIEIQDWRDEDEGIVEALRRALTASSAPGDALVGGSYAAHAVAAAVSVALARNGNVARLMGRMKAVLKRMHDANPSWGPLFITHRGAFHRHIAYVRH